MRHSTPGHELRSQKKLKKLVVALQVRFDLLEDYARPGTGKNTAIWSWRLSPVPTCVINGRNYFVWLCHSATAGDCKCAKLQLSR
jgi:hypothetical protein